jgi:FkbM family methyltransferase
LFLSKPILAWSNIELVHGLNDVQVTVINAIVAKSSNVETAPFYLRKDFWSASMSPMPADYVEIVQVPVLGINELVQKYQPNVVIVDIEGGEIDLIEGKWPENLRLIIMEVHPDVIGNHGLEQIIGFFKEMGFTTNLEGPMLTMTR